MESTLAMARDWVQLNLDGYRNGVLNHSRRIANFGRQDVPVNSGDFVALIRAQACMTTFRQVRQLILRRHVTDDNVLDRLSEFAEDLEETSTPSLQPAGPAELMSHAVHLVAHDERQRVAQALHDFVNAHTPARPSLQVVE